MTVYLHHIATATPPRPITSRKWGRGCRNWRATTASAACSRLFTARPGSPPGTPALPASARISSAGTTHGELLEPGTGARNAIYFSEARQLGLSAGRQLLEQMPEIAPGDITHVVTASCTGFFNPGLDYFLVRDLGLPTTTERYHLGFMGCYAAFPALRMAAQFCQANPQANVLVLCLELCSLHIQLGDREDQLLANALFADGAAAALVSARLAAAGRPALQLERFASALVPEGEADMAWSIGDHGFDIALSSYVPKILGANIAGVVDGLLTDAGYTRDAIDVWAVHPGGKSILDQIERSLALRPEQLHPLAPDSEGLRQHEQRHHPLRPARPAGGSGWQPGGGSAAWPSARD